MPSLDPTALAAHTSAVLRTRAAYYELLEDLDAEKSESLDNACDQARGPSLSDRLSGLRHANETPSEVRPEKSSEVHGPRRPRWPLVSPRDIGRSE